MVVRRLPLIEERPRRGPNPLAVVDCRPRRRTSHTTHSGQGEGVLSLFDCRPPRPEGERAEAGRVRSQGLASSGFQSTGGSGGRATGRKEGRGENGGRWTPRRIGDEGVGEGCPRTLEPRA